MAASEYRQPPAAPVAINFDVVVDAGEERKGNL
jgi:hypothetical protein